jgi:hypothetical protein
VERLRGLPIRHAIGATLSDRPRWSKNVAQLAELRYNRFMSDAAYELAQDFANKIIHLSRRPGGRVFLDHLLLQMQVQGLLGPWIELMRKRDEMGDAERREKLLTHCVGWDTYEAAVMFHTPTRSLRATWEWVERTRREAECDPDTGEHLEGASMFMTALDRAISFLRAALANGPMPTHDVVRMAAEEGISTRTLTRARKIVGARSARGTGMPARYWLSLPGPR